MLLQRSKFVHKFYIKGSLTAGELKFHKLSTIYNQLNVEDSSSFDNFLLEYYQSLPDSTLSTLFSFQPVVNLVLWKRGTKTSTYFRFFSSSSELLLKHFLPRQKYFLPFFYKLLNFQKVEDFYLLVNVVWRKLNKFFLFSQFFVQSSFNDSEYGLLFDKEKFDILGKTIPGYVYSYAFRSKMLGRKINFRDRTQRKKIEIV